MRKRNMNNIKKSAISFFHSAPNNYNCAQAIIKRFQDNSITYISDEKIEQDFRSKGGGRAEGGICGAIYSAYVLLGKNKGDEIKIKAENILGGTTCRKLKGELKVSCIHIVDTIDKLIESEIL